MSLKDGVENVKEGLLAGEGDVVDVVEGDEARIDLVATATGLKYEEKGLIHFFKNNSVLKYCSDRLADLACCREFNNFVNKKGFGMPQLPLSRCQKAFEKPIVYFHALK